MRQVLKRASSLRFILMTLASVSSNVQTLHSASSKRQWRWMIVAKWRWAVGGSVIALTHIMVCVWTISTCQWDLVCDRNVLPEASQMVFNFGVMFGAILFGFLSDRYGRKKSFVAALVIQAVVGCATAFSPDFYLFTALRFIVGALEQVGGSVVTRWCSSSITWPTLVLFHALFENTIHSWVTGRGVLVSK